MVAPVTTDDELNEICAALRDLFDARCCLCGLLTEDGTNVVFVAGDGTSVELIIGASLRVGEGIAGFVAQTGEAIVIDDIAADGRFSSTMVDRARYWPTTLYGAPLVVDGRVIGILHVTDPSRDVVAEAEATMGGLLPLLVLTADEVAGFVTRRQGTGAGFEPGEGPGPALLSRVRRLVGASAG